MQQICHIMSRNLCFKLYLILLNICQTSTCYHFAIAAINSGSLSSLMLRLQSVAMLTFNQKTYIPEGFSMSEKSKRFTMSTITNVFHVPAFVCYIQGKNMIEKTELLSKKSINSFGLGIRHSYNLYDFKKSNFAMLLFKY